MTTEFKLVPAEPTAEMNHAGDMSYSWDVAKIYRAMLAAAPTLPQPVYDEAKERELFETWALEQIGPYFNKHEDCLVRTDHGGYVYGQTVTSWLSWQACAQSRAKAGEVGHE
ncbi:hypothetical protein AB3967_08515 [Pseudomonas rhodesiae]|uniref:hypothetical protein n=1 Tax=Pseudomonas rhodesiae TaxID=76760 RepID=UPI0016198F95